MSDLYWLTDEQMARLAPYFPKSHGKPRVDGRTEKSKPANIDSNPQRSNVPNPNCGIVHASFGLSVRFRTALVLTPRKEVCPLASFRLDIQLIFNL